MTIPAKPTEKEPTDMLDDGPYPDDLRCQDCGRHHQLDAVIPSPIWNKIAPDAGLLCVDCIDTRCVKAGISIENMVRFYWTGKAGSSYLYDDERREKEPTDMLEGMGKETVELDIGTVDRVINSLGYWLMLSDDRLSENGAEDHNRVLREAAELLKQAATALAAKDAEIAKWKNLGQSILDNDPMSDAADGVSCLDVWRKDIRAALAAKGK